MSYSQTELSELVCTRISHDLIGNIGALSGALELIKENGDVLDGDTHQIIATATNTLKARQKFFRLAFGMDNSLVEMPELLEICKDYLATVGNRSAAIELQTTGVTANLAKILCLSVMTAAEICIKGGRINVSVNKQNLQITLDSDYKLAANKLAAYNQIVNNQKPDENISQYVQLIYLRAVIGEDVTMKIENTETSMTITVG